MDPGASPPAGDDIHVALLGAGRHGRDLLNYAFDIPGVRFKAVCDIWPYARTYAANLLKRRGHPVGAYEDYREMLAAEKDLHAAIIATPDFAHADQAVACLEAGLHVYCEKEMHHTVAGARRMVQAARRSGRLLQVGRQHRSNPRYIQALECVRTHRALGRITAVFGQWHGHQRIKYTWPEKYAMDEATLAKYGYASMEELKNWRYFRRFSGGEIANLGSHQIDVFNWFLGAPPKAVLASGGLDTIRFYEWYDNVVCLFEWDCAGEGARHTVRGGYRILNTLEHGGFRETFYGDRATLDLSEMAHVGFLAYDEGRPRVPVPPGGEARSACGLPVLDLRPRADAPPPPLPSPRDPDFPRTRATLLPPALDHPVHWYHLVNFFDALRGRCGLNCPAEVGLEACVSALKVNEAMEAGRRLEYRPEDFRA